MKIAYFDLIGGASGDMILGALLDAGLSLTALQADLSALNLPAWSLETARVIRRGIAATRAIVRVEDSHLERTYADLDSLVSTSDLPPEIRFASLNILERIARVEATIHNVELNSLHLHELGGLDTIIDIVGSVAGLRRLGIEKAFCSPFPLARGLITSAHGIFPLPAPAVVALLREKKSPVIGVTGDFETVTPTGAAILTQISERYGDLPSMQLEATGYGAGSRDDISRPNLLRLFVGESREDANGVQVQSLTVLETNIDDLNPQFYDHVMTRLFASGALDVTLTPLHMKKNRPGTLLRVLCAGDSAPALREILFAETSTLGVREQQVARYSITREIIPIETSFGTVRIKVAHRPTGQVTVAPEYEDCKSVADRSGVPLQQVWAKLVEEARIALKSR